MKRNFLGRDGLIFSYAGVLAFVLDLICVVAIAGAGIALLNHDEKTCIGCLAISTVLAGISGTIWYCVAQFR